MPGSGDDDPEGGCLLDRLADSGRTTAAEEGPLDRTDEAPKVTWLRQQLDDLEPGLRVLVVGRIHTGCTWVELGRQLGIPARQAQRRCTAVLDRLQREGLAWNREPREPDGVPVPGLRPLRTEG